VGPGLPGGHVGSRGMEETVGPGLPVGHVGTKGIAGAVGPRLLPAILFTWSWREVWALGSRSAMLVPGAWRDLCAQVYCQTCWFPGKAGAVGLGLLTVMLVSRAWQEMWAWGCPRPCCFPGHAGSCGPKGAVRHVGSRGMAAPVDPGLPEDHVGSWLMAEAVGSGLPPAMLIPAA